ncbi:flagellar export protein FliJ [Veronia pacifica]|uniref:Flagellar FliJ protein n=1 Tax=Veronia pacifica TaxID=1080227 RepID=A0A1C3EEE0_9GAMM|nr:flagellar export protein FliJ [Veronia pacifica]ODA31606.1 flagellar protein FliJ [Veronia pacifica]
MANSALELLLERAQSDEQNAQLALVSAQQELEGYRRQLEQIEQYRFDYCKQMTARGQQGLTASNYGHLNRFIVQLDETLAKQRQAAGAFEQKVEDCRTYWHSCREKTRSLDWLCEKRRNEEKIRAEKLEQKQMDEFATLSYFRQQQKKSNLA